MIIEIPTGARWHVYDAQKKLACRARLPGAHVYDLAVQSLRDAKDRGMSGPHRLVLAFPASWLVNSPAISRVLRRWSLPPERQVWLELLELLEKSEGCLLADDVAPCIERLGEEPYAIEAISKVLALLVPEAVPLMPPLARTFVLGGSARPSAEEPADAAVFVSMVNWFLSATRAHASDLSTLAGRHEEVALAPAQVLDRLLWFDSDGYRHFKGEGLAEAKLAR